MNKLAYIALIVLLSASSRLIGQTYSPNSNNTYTTCSGTFYDSGGANNDYGNNQDYTVTFCSGNGQPIYLNFTNFNLQNGNDFLLIYAGNSVASPQIGTYSANSPGTVVSANGCITFRFVSNNTNSDPGWSAIIGCGTPPSATINMSNGSSTTCNTAFYDNGGPNNDYTNNQNLTYTICPGTAGSFVQVDFTAFNLQNNDNLQIYNGPNTTSPLIGTYTGTISPGLIQATAPNTGGCLTFRFISNGNGNTNGWVAAVSCYTPCQTITANILAATSPAPQADGIIRICAGGSVNFVGSGTFSQSGVGASYLWDFGNGTTGNTASSTATYASVGTYIVDFDISLNGCTNSNTIAQVVQVAAPPTITTAASPLVLCQGQSSNLSATVANTPYIFDCTTPYSGLTYLLDGNGVTYTTTIPVDCYNPSQTVQSAADISNICLNMEHSYLGDLSIVITCPNGQSTTLHNYPGGGGTYLGCPLDDPATTPGAYSTYCFTPTATTLLVNGATTNCGTPSFNAINGGNYMPAQPFTTLIGCPLDGNWTISVTDHLNLDNGYISSWDINFNPNIPGVNGSFTPTVVSQGWITTPGLALTGATTATVTPSSVGQNCYTYSATNNFGCTTTQVQCVTVTPGVVPTFTQLGPYCQGAAAGILPTTSTNGISGTWSSALSTTVAGSIVYTFTPNAGQCASPTTMTVVVNPELIATISAPPILCPGATTTITVGASGGTGPYTGTATYTLTAGTYTYTVTDANGCTSTVTITIADPSPIVLPNITHN